MVIKQSLEIEKEGGLSGSREAPGTGYWEVWKRQGKELAGKEEVFQLHR